MDISKIAGILESIELSDAQVVALDGFFEEYTKNIVDKTKKGLANEIKAQITEEVNKNIPKDVKQAEKAFDLFENDTRKAFELFEGDAEKAFDLFEKDAEKAFELYKEDLQKEYTERMRKALLDIYEDIEGRVKKDLVESNEFKALDSIKKAVAPIMLSEEQKSIIKQAEAIKAERQAVTEEKAEMEKEKVIKTLIEDFPKEYAVAVEKFINQAKNVDEVYERFNTMVEMIDIDTNNKKKTGDVPRFKRKISAQSSKNQEVANETDSMTLQTEEVKRNKKAAPIFESTTKNTQPVKENEMLSEEERNILNLVFPMKANA